MQLATPQAIVAGHSEWQTRLAVGDGDPLVDVYRGRAGRPPHHFEVLRKTIGGIVVSDLLSAYNYLSVDKRQLCWAHQRQDWPGTVNVAAAICAVASMAERRC